MKHSGQIVGETRSGKAIFAFGMDEELRFPHPGNVVFSVDDHLDAYAIFEALALRAKRNSGSKSIEHKYYLAHFWAHADVPELIAGFDGAKAIAGCRNAFDLVALGRRLCSPEFQDF